MGGVRGAETDRQREREKQTDRQKPASKLMLTTNTFVAPLMAWPALSACLCDTHNGRWQKSIVFSPCVSRGVNQGICPPTSKITAQHQRGAH